MVGHGSLSFDSPTTWPIKMQYNNSSCFHSDPAHLLNPFFLDLLDPIKGLAALEVDLQHGLHLLPILPALLSLALLIPPVLPQVGAGHL